MASARVRGVRPPSSAAGSASVQGDYEKRYRLVCDSSDQLRYPRCSSAANSLIASHTKGWYTDLIEQLIITVSTPLLLRKNDEAQPRASAPDQAILPKKSLLVSADSLSGFAAATDVLVEDD